MASLAVDGDDLVVRLRPLEKLGAFHGDVRVPRSAIRSVRAVEKGWPELRGMRAPGTGVPGVISLGSRRGTGIHDFVAVYGSRSAVVVDLEGADFDRLVIADDAAEETARRLTP
jgi:hypothetical protein